MERLFPINRDRTASLGGLALATSLMIPACAGASEQPAPLCDAACIRTNMDRAVPACTPQIEAQAPLDFDWLHRPVPGIFQSAEQPAPDDPVVRYRGDLIRFQTPQKDWERMSYECGFDTRAGRVVSLQMHPGRLPTQRDAVTASVILPGSRPQPLQARLMPEAAAPQAAPAPAQVRRKPAPRVGEPSPIEIEQQAPRVRP